MTKTRMGIPSVTFPSMGPIRVQCVSLMSKSRNFYQLFLSHSSSYFPERNMLMS